VRRRASARVAHPRPARVGASLTAPDPLRAMPSPPARSYALALYGLNCYHSFKAHAWAVGAPPPTLSSIAREAATDKIAVAMVIGVIGLFAISTTGP